jgi:hypothetical protein
VEGRQVFRVHFLAARLIFEEAMTNLSETIDQYRLAIEQLAPESAEGLNQRLLSLLIARDALHQSVKTGALKRLRPCNQCLSFAAK